MNAHIGSYVEGTSAVAHDERVCPLAIRPEMQAFLRQDSSDHTGLDDVRCRLSELSARAETALQGGAS